MSNAIQRKRDDFAAALFQAVELARRAAGAAPVSRLAEADRFTQANINTAVDLVARWAGTKDPAMLALFIGWVNLCANERLDKTGPADFSQAPLERTWQTWEDLIAADAGAELCCFHGSLRQATESLRQKTEKATRVLFIGDCLQCDILTSLYGPCLQAGISLVPKTLAHRVPASLRNEIRKLESQKFDVVFFSPFSHEFSSDYAHVIHPKNYLMSARAADAFLNAAIQDTEEALDLLANQFECPIYVHNTGGTQQHNSGFSGLGKLLLSARLRRHARERLNGALTELLAERNAATYEHLFVVDEEALARRIGVYQLGRIWFNSGTLHPTLLGNMLGREDYFRAIYIQAYLATRKVIVCDLDNTLWDGMIGEGAVSHFHERQEVLKGLQQKGLLLAINSKNDPRKVHWKGGTLQEEDFVTAQINWSPKTQNINRIRDELNLKVKDFMFLDDRPDEREQVNAAFPEIHVLDPMDALTWKLLDHWQRVLPNQVDEDRTKLYRERACREQFVTQLSQNRTDADDETTAFKALGLSVEIHEAERADLKRVVELINRTNQFNLCGSRTSFRELSEGLGQDRLIILADARDKFGDMGTVGVLVIERKVGGFEIPIFVLSCRVFGFRIEYTLLNTVKRMVDVGVTVRGLYRDTPHNEPCRKVYSEAGFRWDGKFWTGQTFKTMDDPVWLSVTTHIAPKPFWRGPGIEIRQTGCPAGGIL